MKKEDIKISVEDGFLNIKAKKTSKKEKKDNTSYSLERTSNVLSRKVKLSEEIDYDNINAKYENGLLIINFNKYEDTKKYIEIN